MEYGGRIVTAVINAANFLEAFDEEMAAMDDASVPEEGRILYVTPAMRKIVKEAEGIQRVISISTPSTINRKVHSPDDVTIKSVLSARMKAKYNFTDVGWIFVSKPLLFGFVPFGKKGGRL